LVSCKKRKAPSNNTSSNSSNALLPATTTRVATTQEFQKHKKSVAFEHEATGNKVFLELKMRRKKEMKCM
jgi:hypothetical protein